MGYDISEVYQSNSDFLKADDIGSNFWTATINKVDMKEFDDGSRKLFVMFNDLEKGLVLNKTNADTIGDLYGKNTDNWVGKPVMLFTMPVDYQGKKVNAIRVRAPAQNQQQGGSIGQQSHQRPLNHGYAQQSGGTMAYDDRNPPPVSSADEYAN
jgi:hypothetical protein